MFVCWTDGGGGETGDKIVAIKSNVTVAMRRCPLLALRSMEDIFSDEQGERDRVHRDGN